MSKKLGIIGWPVEHSLSPAMHNAAFAALGLTDWHYELLPTQPDDLKDRLDHLSDAGYSGINVTVPHKQAVMPHLHHISLAARGIGSVNTILFEDGRREGHNTDSVGFMLDLAAHQVDVSQQEVLVLGAGGSAHAVVLGLANRGAQVTLVSRREQQAWQLRENIRKGVSAQLKIDVQAPHSLAKIGSRFRLIVNCTPVGMWPHVDASPWPDELPIPSQAVVYDLVYRPAQTRLMQQAIASGAQAIGGLGMLVYQGAAAFELWTGQAAPVDVMFEAVEAALQA